MARVKPQAEEKAPQPDPRSGLPIAKILRWSATAAVTALVCIYVSRSIWIAVRDRIATSAEYQLSAEKITLTPTPEWIHVDVKGEIIRDGSLEGGVSLLDERLTERIHTAVLLHPWVQDATVQVSYPASVHVDVVYRKPVAMVEVPGGLLPIDRFGVLLPSDDFSPLTAIKYPRIIKINGGPIGGIGVEWGDPDVHGAVLVAEQLLPVWDLYALATVEPVATTDAKTLFQVRSKSGWRIVWGHAPGEESAAEPKAAEKVVWLKKQYPAPPDSKSAVIDLQRPQATSGHDRQ